MVRYSKRILDQVFTTEASVKEQRRITYTRNTVNKWEHSSSCGLASMVKRSTRSSKYSKSIPIVWDQECPSDKNWEPQIGLEIIQQAQFFGEVLQHLQSFASVSIDDEIVRRIESISIYFMGLTQMHTWKQVASVTLLYLQTWTTRSMSQTIFEYLKEIMEFDKYEEQAGEEPDWLQTVKSVGNNWQLIKSNRAFKQVSKLLGVLVTLQLCNISDLEFTIGGFKLFEVPLLEKHLTAFELADAIFSTITYFTEGAYLCYKTRSFKPILLNDFALVELDNKYIEMLSLWDLVQNGNLYKFKGLDDSYFVELLDSITMEITGLVAVSKGLDKKLLSDKLFKCKTIKNELIRIKISSGLRESPFTIELFGKSNQGKTTFCDQLIDSLLISAGLDTSKSRRAAINTGDKFMSNWTTDKLVAIFDDMANEKKDFVEKPPTRAIIDFCNNQMFYAPKAELEAKGKTFVEPKLVMVTTNVKDLDAFSYSNCPYSIQRRMHYVITVECKKEFQLMAGKKALGVDSAKVEAHYTKDGVYSPPPIDDIWNLSVEKAIEPEDLYTVAKYAAVEDRGETLTNVSASRVISFLIDRYEDHRNAQRKIIDSMQDRSKILTRCGVDGCCQLKNYCPKHKFEQQSGLAGVAFALYRIRNQFTNRLKTDKTLFVDRVCEEVTSSLYKRSTTFLQKWDWLCLIPEDVFDSDKFQDLLQWYYKDDMNSGFRTTRWYVYLIVLFITRFHVSFGLVLFFFLWIWNQIYEKSYVRARFLKELKRRNDTIPLIVKSTRDDYARVICGASVAIAALYAVSKIYSHYRAINPTQGSLEVRSEADIVARDAEPNIWASVWKRPLPCSQKSMEHTMDVVQRKVAKNLLYATIIGDDGINRMGNVLFVDSNMVLVPNHYFEQANSDSLRLTCYKENASSIGGSFITRVDKCASHHIDSTDLRLCYSPSGGSYSNLVEYFPTGDLVDHPFKMIWRSKKGELVHASGSAKAKITTNSVCIFKGGEYSNLSINTFNGLCGGVIISDKKQTCITGLHLGGIPDTPRGCFGTLTQEQLCKAISLVREVPGVIKTGTEGEFKPQVMGVNFVLNDPLHPKSPVNYLPEGSQLSYLGSCTGKVTSHSDVRETLISPLVKQATGVVNIWGKPKMKPEYEGWQKALANASHPAEPVPHALLLKSIRDYSKPLLQLASQKPWCDESPLSDHENLCGRVGCKFIDAIQLNTSIGYPLSGPKRRYVIELDPTPDRPNNRVLEQDIMDYIKSCEDEYRKGVRNHFVAKACKKDEILPIAKGKCRIFYANPIALTWLVRKYFLPIIRMLQMNPLVSECAVGINCHGPEWNEFYQFVTAFGQDTIIGGDYGKYDQKLPSQKLIASMGILIDIARRMQYEPDDIAIMEAMVGDIVYAIIACNGDLLSIQSGTHISGNSLTVILNGISGSLNLRDYFYTKYDESVDFRSAVKLMTYGDDNIGSVNPSYTDFNIKGASEFLASYGQIYTMPDKESELRPFLKPEEFEFLKRTSVYHKDLGCYIGALADNSIIKSLHCYLRPKGAPLTPEEACAQNIDTALREWFNHGRDVYERRREEMNNVAHGACITHMCDMLDRTYDDMVIDWKYKYAGGPAPIEGSGENFTL